MEKVNVILNGQLLFRVDGREETAGSNDGVTIPAGKDRETANAGNTGVTMVVAMPCPDKTGRKDET